MSLRDASAQAGVSVSWLRKQYREHSLPTRETAGPRGRQKAVPLEEVLARAAVFTTPPAAMPPPTPSPAPSPAELDRTALALLDRVIEVERRAAKAEAECAFLMLRLDDAYAEIDELRRRLAVILESPAALPSSG